MPPPAAVPFALCETAPTIASLDAEPLRPAADSTKALVTEPRNKIAAKPIYFVGLFALIIAVGIGIVLYQSTSCPTVVVVCQPLQGYAYCHVDQAASDRKLGLSEPGRSVCSLAAMAEQRRAFSDNAKIKWSVSPGNITEQTNNGEEIRIDTSGLDGQNLTATASVSGLGWFCSTSASETFAVPRIAGVNR